MSMLRPVFAAAAICVGVSFLATTSVEARTRKHPSPQGQTLTVKKRSFLDSGKVVPVGSESNYVTAGQYFTRTSDYYYARGRYGNETLPGRFDLPGGEPLFKF